MFLNLKKVSSDSHLLNEDGSIIAAGRNSRHGSRPMAPQFGFPQQPFPFGFPQMMKGLQLQSPDIAQMEQAQVPQMQMPQMPQFQMPQMQMPQMPQMQMPQMPQMQMPQFSMLAQLFGDLKMQRRQ